MSADYKKAEYAAKLEAVVKRTDKFQPLFDSDIFKEWLAILSKKIEGYHKVFEKIPHIGDIQYADQIEDFQGNRKITKIPSRVTLEQRNEMISEYTHRIDEVQSIIDIPALMKKDSERMKVELEKISQAESGDKS